jgi:hypothetical protein
MPRLTAQQAMASVQVCQMISNLFRAIYVFRFDETRSSIYIQFGTPDKTDELEIEIYFDGEWRFI